MRLIRIEGRWLIQDQSPVCRADRIDRHRGKRSEVECGMTKCAAATGTGTVAMLMLPDRDECRLGIDCSAVVLVSWRFVTVMMVAIAGVRGKLCAGRNPVNVAAVPVRRGMRV